MKKHGANKWESRLFSLSPSKGISWDGKKKKKLILPSEISKVGDTDAAPNQMLKKCGFTIVLSNGKVYTLCAASQRQKLEVASKVMDIREMSAIHVQSEREREEREAILAKQALFEKERIAKEKRELTMQREREAQEAVLAKQAAVEKEAWEAKKREELEMREARRKAVEEEERTRLMVEEERKRLAESKLQVLRSSGAAVPRVSGAAPVPAPRASGAPSPTPAPRTSNVSPPRGSAVEARGSPAVSRSLPRAAVAVHPVDNRATVLLDAETVAARTSNRDLENRATVMLSPNSAARRLAAPTTEAPLPPASRRSNASSFDGRILVKIPKKSSFDVAKHLEEPLAQARDECEVSLHEVSEMFQIRLVGATEEKLSKTLDFLNAEVARIVKDYEKWVAGGDSLLEAYDMIEADDVSALLEDELVDLIQNRDDL